MPPTTDNQSAHLWLYFALMTVLSWGVYGILLHKGQVAMADPANGRYKAFLFVGIAYFITAVLAPLAVLVMNKADWSMPQGGMWWSLVAGIAGAIGAFAVLLAFGYGGRPASVMAIIFAGAPIVNGLLDTALHKNWGNVRPQFWIGIVLAATGGFLVAYFKPAPPKAHGTKPAITAPAVASTSNPARH